MRRPAPTRRATSAVPEAVPPPRATSDRLQYETRWPRILLPKGSRSSSQFSASPRLTHARLFQVEVVRSRPCRPGTLPAGRPRRPLGGPWCTKHADIYLSLPVLGVVLHSRI